MLQGEGQHLEVHPLCWALGAVLSSASLPASPRSNLSWLRALTAGPSRLGSETWARRWQQPPT
eukprot:6412182-Pyramimonas_sp.AAC.1